MIIGSRSTYVGSAHAYLRDREVEIVAVHRGDDPDTRQILTEDEAVGDLRPEDLVEVAPFVLDGGIRRRSWATSDASPADLRACREEAVAQESIA